MEEKERQMELEAGRTLVGAMEEEEKQRKLEAGRALVRVRLRKNTCLNPLRKILQVPAHY